MIDGWFKTREIASIGSNETTDGFALEGHLDTVLEPVQGTFVFASSLENIYQESSVVKQIFIYCLPYRQLVAVIHPDKDMLFLMAHMKQVESGFGLEMLCDNDEVHKVVLNSLLQAAEEAKLRTYELIHAVHLTAEPFSVQNNLVTPTLELRRNKIAETYRPNIISMYRSLGVKLSSEKAFVSLWTSSGIPHDDQFDETRVMC